jgi:hypothetical protein
MLGDRVMRKYLLLTLLTTAVLFSGCATAAKTSGSGERGGSGSGASGY